MDEKQFEKLMQPAVNALIEKTRRFCLNFFGSDDAALVADFINETENAAKAFGSHDRYLKFIQFQAEMCRDMIAAEKFYNERIFQK